MRKLSFVFVLITLISCNSPQNERRANSGDRKDIIEFLKKEYKVFPEVDRFDSIYLAELRVKKINLEIDSLINSKLRTYRHKSLPIELIDYDNHFGYKDRVREDFFSISLVRNTNSGKIYLDFIDPDAGMIKEDYCAYSWIKAISEKDIRELSVADLKLFNSIDNSRMFGEYETRFKAQRRGLEAFLNDEFRFVRPSKMQLDSLFKFYDESANNSLDTLVNNPEDLLRYLAWQANIIKGQNNYGNESSNLAYLKDQICLLMLRGSNSDSTSSVLWLYKSNRRLRTRDLLINGTSKSGFNYFIKEEVLCFP